MEEQDNNKALIQHYSVYDIDAQNEVSDLVKVDHIAEVDLLKFLRKIAGGTRTSPSMRQASFRTGSPVKAYLEAIISKDEVELNSQKIANLLLESEVKYTEMMQRLKRELKKGSLVITRFYMGETELLLLSKIDFEKYLERGTLESKLGLPEEKALLKSCLIEIENGKMSESILLADSNSSIAKFWWDEFLKSEFARTSAENTKLAFSKLEQSISYIKPISPEDHRDIRNNLISYFKTAKMFNFEEMMDRVIGNFKPESSAVDLNKLKTKIENIKKKDKFDGSFEIDPKEVKARARKQYSLDNDVELVAYAGTSNIFSAAKDNEEYILVKSKRGSADFKKIDFFDEQ